MFWGITSCLFLLGACFLYPSWEPMQDLNAKKQPMQSSVAKPGPGDNKGQPPVKPDCYAPRAPGTRPICR